MSTNGSSFERALAVGRPPNIQRLFPHSKALIVSGKVIDAAMRAKGKAIAIAANGRNHQVIRGALAAAQRANAGLLVEIAKSEGGRDAYCAVNFWNLARHVDAVANELGITVPIAIHADHYGLKKPSDVEVARAEIPTLFDWGVTSIAIDASHMQDDENLLASLALADLVPDWCGHETEVGEIKGKEGMSNVDDAQFLIKGLNAHGIFPTWIALNNGSAHGIQTSDHGIQVELTKEIHEALVPYNVSGAQHGTSGNSTNRLRTIAKETNTTKANVATALQMISWGVRVNDYGNAELDDDGNFVKVPGEGVSEELWARMMAFAAENNFTGGNVKKISRPLDNYLMSEPRAVRERMAKGVENFVYNLLTEVFDCENTAPLAYELLCDADGPDVGTRATRIEDPAEWTEEKIREKAKLLCSDKGAEGDWED